MSKSKPPVGGYEIGYKRPPKAHQFKKGQINNPKGRPKGRIDAAALLLREAGRLVRVRKGEDVVTISRGEALVRALFNKALEGDLAAARIVLPYLVQADAQTLPVGIDRKDAMVVAEAPVPQMDEDAVRRMLARFSHLALSEEEDGP